MNEINVNFRDGVIDDGYMWVFDNVLQAVCRIDLDSMVMDIVQKYEGEKDITIGWILKHQKSLYMIRHDIPGILIYDRIKKRFYERFDVPEMGCEKLMVSTAILHENNLWIFPVWLENSAYRYDIKKGKFFVENEIINVVKRHKSSPKIFSPFLHKENDSIWMVSFGGDAYWRYDLKNKTEELYEFNEADIRLSGICNFNGRRFFSFIDSSKIMCVNAEGECDVWEGIENENEPFANIVNVGDYILFIPRQSTNIVILNIQNGEIRKVELEKENTGTYIYERMRNYCIDDNKIYLFPFQMNEMYVMDINSGEVYKEPIKTVFLYDLEQVKGKIKRQNMIKEDKDTSFKGFIKYCVKLEI